MQEYEQCIGRINLPGKLLVCSILLLLLSACKNNMLFRGKSPHEVYASRLQRAELHNSAMARQWFTAAEKSLRRPLGVVLPYKETGFFPPGDPLAYGYIFSAEQGHKINVTVSVQSTDKVQLFAELWEPAGAENEPKLLQFADSAGRLTYEAEKDMKLILRLQTELLAAVSYTLQVTAGPSLAFPVLGGDNADIGSVWGDPRNGGSRRHEGIDIFGKRGTPALAAADGRIVSVNEGGLGGKTVFMRPSGKNISLYYAHLDSQLVKFGQRVATGDTIGLVGNTGNARTTAPHLHFGIYSYGGAVNPMPYVRRQIKTPPSIAGDTAFIGTSGRITSARDLYASLASKEKNTTQDKDTYIIVTAVAGDYYKVILPGGEEGFLLHRSFKPLKDKLSRISVDATTQILFKPFSNSAVVSYVSSGKLPVKARYKDYAYIETDTLRGWVLNL